MQNKKTTTRIHPLFAGAAISVMLASLVAGAAITGLIPVSRSSDVPAIASPYTPTTTATLPEQNSPIRNLAPSSMQAESFNRKSSAESGVNYDNADRTASVHEICTSCGKIESIHTIHHQAPASGVGMVAGAVLGGVLGNQVGGGNGRNVATVAGAVGGGYAGNEIEKRGRSSTTYEVRVRMENGHVRTFPYSAQPRWEIGDQVRVVNGNLSSRT